ncbi:hypothetical protein SD81_026230 [Tolypothrix campylonemoides VB511288]|nr:hypothetical protein SD81_026230 [Tolypothrix campylonemoides VB511288]
MLREKLKQELDKLNEEQLKKIRLLAKVKKRECHSVRVACPIGQGGHSVPQRSVSMRIARRRQH